MTYRTESEHWAAEREHVARRNARADNAMLWLAIIATPAVIIAAYALQFVGG